MFDVVRAVVPKIDLDNVFIAKEEIAQDVQATLTKARCVRRLSVQCLWRLLSLACHTQRWHLAMLGSAL